MEFVWLFGAAAAVGILIAKIVGVLPVAGEFVIKVGDFLLTKVFGTGSRSTLHRFIRKYSFPILMLCGALFFPFWLRCTGGNFFCNDAYHPGVLFVSGSIAFIAFGLAVSNKMFEEKEGDQILPRKTKEPSRRNQ
jgi:hypothetical protein